MGTVYRPTRFDPKQNKRVKYKRYRIAYVDEDGDRKTERAFTDKGASQALLATREKEVERKKAGLSVVSEKDRQRKYAECVEKYRDELKRLERSPVHWKNAESSLKRTGAWCGWETIAQIRPAKLRDYLAHRKKEGLSARTVNADRDYLCHSMDYLIAQGWAAENVIRQVAKAPAGPRQRVRRRRAYTPAELARLLAAAPRDRRLVYLVAATSGLRRSELGRIERRDFDLSNPDRPRWTLRAQVSKNGLAWTIPMTSECAAGLATLPAGRPTERVFPKLPRTKTVNADLRRAKIEKKDELGRGVDLHSLRYFFCTQLALTMPVQKVRVLMRHQTLRQTCDLYLDLGLDDVADDVWSLPKMIIAIAQKKEEKP
jgi:integrase